MAIKSVPKIFKIAYETSFFFQWKLRMCTFNGETKSIVAHIRARGFCCKVATHKFSNVHSYYFQWFRYRPDRHAMSNNMVNSQIKNPLFTRKKNSGTKIDSQNFKQHFHQRFFAKKSVLVFTSCFSPQMKSFCKQTYRIEKLDLSINCTF